jgi:phosphoacetylglucosamine mutase
MIVTNDTETRCVEPLELQAGLDQAVQEMNDPAARCFVRPSGTENVVRIYAEAGTLAGAQALAQQALEVVQRTTSTGATQQSKM